MQPGQVMLTKRQLQRPSEAYTFQDYINTRTIKLKLYYQQHIICILVFQYQIYLMIKYIDHKIIQSKISLQPMSIISSKCALSQIKCKKSSRKSQICLHNNKIIATNKVGSSQRGKTVDFLHQRKQSILNSYYNKRKVNLVNITKENRKIYERINSQKSSYSSRNLNKSYNSKCSRISNRSSSSKNSKCNISSRQSSVRISKCQKQNKNKNDLIKPILKVQRVNTINKQQIIVFNRIFNRKNQEKSTKVIKNNIDSKKIKKHDENKMTQIKEYPIQNGKQMQKKRIFQNFTPDRQSIQNVKNTKFSMRILNPLQAKSNKLGSILQKRIKNQAQKHI